MFELDQLTLNPQEETEVSKAVFEKVLILGAIADHHEIHTGIQHKTQIPFIGTMGLVGKKIIGCKPTANGNKIPMSEKFWDPILIGDRFEHCALDTDPLFKLFKKALRINPDYYDKIGSEELGVVATRIEEEMAAMLMRIVWFGDTTVETVAEGGYLTNGTDPAFFNVLDGLWKQIISTDIPTTAKNYVAITQNSGVSYAAQQTLPADFAFKLFKDMWKKADARLKQIVQKGGVKIHIHVTSAIAENWMDFKEDASLGWTVDKVEDSGLKSLFRSLEVVTRYDWDHIIENYQDNGTVLHLPHRALLTTPSNIPVGTLSTDDLEKLSSFYDRTDEINIMDFRLKLDAKFLEPYMGVAAY
jgi:hypothetical protein